MLHEIWKFKLETTDEQKVDMPRNAKILNIMTQIDEPVLYALVDVKEKKTEYRKIKIFGTGHPIQNVENLTYIGSYSCHNGRLYFHVFEEK